MDYLTFSWATFMWQAKILFNIAAYLHWLHFVISRTTFMWSVNTQVFQEDVFQAKTNTTGDDTFRMSTIKWNIVSVNVVPMFSSRIRPELTYQFQSRLLELLTCRNVLLYWSWTGLWNHFEQTHDPQPNLCSFRWPWGWSTHLTQDP